MSGGRTELEILIKTVADVRGLQLSEAGVKKLEASLGRAQTATKGVARASAEGADAVSQFGRRGSEAKDAFEGLTTVARGGEGAIFGMAKAWRALTVAFFAANPVTATLAVLLGLLPLIQKGFDLIGAAAERSAQQMAGTGERTKAFAEGLKQIGENSEKYIKPAIAQADSLATGQSRLLANPRLPRGGARESQGAHFTCGWNPAMMKQPCIGPLRGRLARRAPTRARRSKCALASRMRCNLAI